MTMKRRGTKRLMTWTSSSLKGKKPLLRRIGSWANSRLSSWKRCRSIARIPQVRLVDFLYWESGLETSWNSRMSFTSRHHLKRRLVSGSLMILMKVTRAVKGDKRRTGTIKNEQRNSTLRDSVYWWSVCWLKSIITAYEIKQFVLKEN